MSKQLKVGDVVPLDYVMNVGGASIKIDDHEMEIRPEFILFCLNCNTDATATVNPECPATILSIPPDPLDALRKCVEALENTDDLTLIEDALSAARALLEGK